MQTVKLKDSIALQYSMAIAIVLIIGQLLFSFIVLYTNFSQQRRDLHARSTTHVRFLSEVMPDSILTNNFYPLETLMQQTAAEEDFVYSVVIHIDGQLITNYLNANNDLVQEAIANADEANTLSRIDYISTLPNIVEVESPIIADGLLIGHVLLGYSTSNLHIRLRNNIITTLIWSITLSLSLIIVTIILFNIQIRTPLRNLSLMAALFAQGNLETRSITRGNTEISQLQRTFNNMADQIQKNVTEMNKLSQVANRTKNAVIITDRMGRIEWVNQAFYDITGYTLEEAQGKTPGSILQGEKSDSLTIDFVRQKLHKGEGFNTEIINYHKSGREYWISIDVRPVYEDDILKNFIAIETDITERKLSEKTLQQSRDALAVYAKELERSNRELQDFAYVASHDLQEPLRKIQAFGSRIEASYNDVLDERGLDYLQRMQNAAHRMQTLIQDLLAFSRVTTQAKPFTQVNLSETLKGVLSDLEIRIQETDTLINIDKQLPLIYAEPLHMRQLFQNLIGNGIKFKHPDRSPKIQINNQIVIKDNQDILQIEFSDNGIGFASKYAEKIFTIFQRLHGRHEYEGTGIGLAVCRRIIEHHDGKIWAVSQEGIGTTFMIELPVRQNVTDDI
ncbi:MAG: hypothetical protein Phog2KO_43230 [Phototrophicaceae bacterium]